MITRTPPDRVTFRSSAAAFTVVGIVLVISLFAVALLRADEPAIPPPVSAANYQALLERAPFRQVLGL